MCFVASLRHTHVLPQSGENATELRKDIIVKRPSDGEEDPSTGRHVNFNIPLSVLRG